MNTLNSTSGCHVTRKKLSRPISSTENGDISRTMGARNTIPKGLGHNQFDICRFKSLMPYHKCSYNFSVFCINTVYIRPHLEYAVQVWNPYLRKDIECVEQIQHRVTKMVNGLRYK